MYVADTKRLTSEGARKVMDTALARAREAGIAVSVAVVDSGGHLVLLERMEGGCPIMAGSECVGAVGVAGGNWEFDERVAKEAAESIQ